MSSSRRFLPTVTPPPGMSASTGANPGRHARALALRSSNAAVPHRNRRRDQARGLGRGRRAGAKAALRREAGVR